MSAPTRRGTYVDLDCFRMDDGRVMVVPGTPNHRMPEEYVPVAERDRYRDREQHFAKVLGVTDGGQYRNDWDSHLTGLLAERDRYREALEEIATATVSPGHIPPPSGYRLRDMAREALNSEAGKR